MAEKIFAKGAFLKDPRDGAPDFVIGTLGIKVAEFKDFLDEHVKANGYVDFDLLRGQNGKPYMALNTYKSEKPEVAKEKTADTIEYPEEDINPDDIPF